MMHTKTIKGILISFTVVISFLQVCLANISPNLITLKKGNQTVYLMGSVHVGQKDFYPLPKYIEDSFQKSDVLAVEVDLSNKDSDKEAEQLFMQHLLFKEPDNLGNYFSPQEIKQIQNISSDETKNIISHIRPWGISVLLSEQAFKQLNYSPKYGVDLYFLDKANKAKKPITELETTKSQVKIFTSISDDDFTKILRTDLNNFSLDTIKKEFLLLIVSWKTGDKEKFELYLREMQEKLKNSSGEKFFNLLFTDRNILMAEKINKLKGKNIFVTIGAAHLYGKGSVTELLKEYGYTEKADN